MKSKDQQLLEEAYLKMLQERDDAYDASQFDPRLNTADPSNRPVADYSEPTEPKRPKWREEERADYQKDNKDSMNPLYYGFKNDIIQRKGKVYWVFSAPEPGKYGTGLERKYKDITNLVNGDNLEGQEFQGKFNRFKIVPITPREHQVRNQHRPTGIMGASYKAIRA